MDRKYQVFISSTFRDLKDERTDIARSVLDLGHIPAAMEYFPAMDEEQLDYIKQIIDQCDYYVLVLAGKYGSTDNEGVSYTEREYDYAVETGKFVLGFPYHDIEKLSREHTETDPAAIEKLKKFRAKVMSGRLVRMWESRQDLDLKITKSLTSAFSRFPQAGWVRTPEMPTEDFVMEISRLQRENARLVEELDKSKNYPEPIVEDLVDMDVQYDFYLDEIDLMNNSRGSQAIKLNWTQIFKIFAASIKGPTTQKDLKSIVARGIKQAAVGPITQPRPNTRAVLKDQYFETMLAQLTAYGLLEEQENSDVKITLPGKALYISTITIKGRG